MIELDKLKAAPDELFKKRHRHPKYKYFCHSDAEAIRLYKAYIPVRFKLLNAHCSGTETRELATLAGGYAIAFALLTGYSAEETFLKSQCLKAAKFSKT